MYKPKPSVGHTQPTKGKSLHSPARQTAFEILLRVETQSSYASELLNGPMTARLDERDAGLCTELVMGALRWQATLDFLAQKYVTKWKSFDPEVKIALRLGLYQLRFLCSEAGRMPARAAIFETVELVKAARKRSASGLVNAVMRKAADDGIGGELSTFRRDDQSATDWLAIETSTPSWMLERWIYQFGHEAAQDLAMANNQAPESFVRFNPSPNRSEADIEQDLLAQGVALRSGNLLKSCHAVLSGNIMRTEAFRRGEVVFQDEASQMVPLLLDVKSGERVLDLCAAPGNKTAQLGGLAGSDGLVVASDIHPHRLSKFAPTPVASRIVRLALDGTNRLPFSEQFDRILVDAPCSGTGTLRRNPEIKWRLTPEDIQTLSDRQSLLLQSASEVLKAGGRLVYSVCSLEAEEEQQVVHRFLDENPNFRLLPIREEAQRLAKEFHTAALPLLDADFLTTLPSVQGVDGFFASLFVRDCD